MNILLSTMWVGLIQSVIDLKIKDWDLLRRNSQHFNVHTLPAFPVCCSAELRLQIATSSLIWVFLSYRLSQESELGSACHSHSEVDQGQSTVTVGGVQDTPLKVWGLKESMHAECWVLRLPVYGPHSTPNIQQPDSYSLGRKLEDSSVKGKDQAKRKISKNTNIWEFPFK